MNLTYDIDKITSYLKSYSNSLPGLYKWNVNLDSLLELDVISSFELNSLSAETPYEKEIFLKDRLKIKLNESYKSDRVLFNKLCLWIIKDWGGIRGVNDERTLELVHQFLNNKKSDFNRIASISKVASYMFPQKYCIYDSRVAYALNWIILSQNAGTKFFPIPEGRNSKMMAFDMKVLIRLFNVQKYAVKNVFGMDERLFVKNRDKHFFIEQDEAYNQLNSLIKQISKELWNDDKSEYLYYTEMLLFSIADREIIQDITNSVKVTILPHTTSIQQPIYMTIYEQIRDYCEGKNGQIVLSSVIKQEINQRYGTNPGSIIPSDYCYNRMNDGILFDKHLFEFIGGGKYKVLGEQYPYSGLVYHKPQHEDEQVVGEWIKGEFFQHKGQ